MQIVHRAMGLWRKRSRPRYALALAGGGVIGGMYEVGALSALEERLASRQAAFDIYVGCSAGSVVAALLASGIRASEIYQIHDQDLDDPLNMRRGVLFAPTLRGWPQRFGRLMWALGKHAIRGRGPACPTCWRAPSATCRPDSSRWPRWSASSGSGWPRADAGTRSASWGARCSSRRWTSTRRSASSSARAIWPRSRSATRWPRPRPFPASSIPTGIGGRDYVDGGVGFCGHADLAAAAGADVVFVVNPLVPNRRNNGHSIGARGVYTIMEQAGRIYSENLLQLGLASLAVKFPRTAFYLLQPPRDTALLFGPSMGFEASRAALRYGYSSPRRGSTSRARLCCAPSLRKPPRCRNLTEYRGVPRLRRGAPSAGGLLRNTRVDRASYAAGSRLTRYPCRSSAWRARRTSRSLRRTS